MKLLKTAFLSIAFMFVLFQVVTPIVGVIPGIGQKAIHVGLVIFLYYFKDMIKEGKKPIERIIDALLLIGGVGSSMYLIYVDKLLPLRAGIIWNSDAVFGLIMIIVLLETTRRVVGMPLTIVASCFLLYAFVGPWMPGLLKHSGVPFKRLMYFTYMTADGILGVALYAAATYIVLFIILGALFQETGVGDFFTSLATSLFGKMRGGPAKIAVIASAFFGSISGSAMANVIGTGTFTIPLMKKTGFDSNYAGAVEAAASTGGQIMPPIMGAAAFIIAEIVGIPYFGLVKAAFIPAVLYFAAILITVDLYSRKNNLKGLQEDAIPKFKSLLKDIYLLLPLIMLVIFMGVFNFTIMKTGIYTIFITMVIVMLAKKTRINKERFVKIVEGSVNGTIPVTIACAVVGIIISVLMLTNLGFRISGILIEASGGNLFLLLVLTMVVSLILGMGMPTTASYLVLAVLVAPAMIKMGVLPLAAHLFIFYFGIISNITPPVALAAYAAAGVARSNPNKTGFIAFKLAFSGFILPFIFVFNPVLLWSGAWHEILLAIITSLVGVYCLSASLENCFYNWQINVFERILLFGAAILLIFPGYITDSIGAIIITMFLLKQIMTSKRNNLNQKVHAE